MTERRKEFNKVRSHILREHNWKTLICARCGRESPSIHFHHINPIADGGTDEPENLIPLCHDCHKEWDTYEAIGVDFGAFLTTLPIHCFASMYYLGAFRPTFQVDLKTVYLLQFTWRSIKRGDGSFWKDFEEQNKFFCQYPYSDPVKMLKLYGKHYEQATWLELEPIVMRVISN